MSEEEILDAEKRKELLSSTKIKKLRNLRYFKNYTDDEIIKWYTLRHGNEAPPENPADLDEEYAETEVETPEEVTFDKKEWKRKYNTYLTKYKKEYSVDMNETNDAEALKALVRYVIQQERIDEIIMEEQSVGTPDHRTLKGLGDFQRSLQMNINELQDKLGISRKARKEKSHDDIPEYIKSIQKKAKNFWDRKTVPVTCSRCNIELARYWLNFPDIVDTVNFELICDKCKEKVSYTV